MTKIVRKLVLLSIMISGTQVIELPLGSLSLFQISLILSIGFGFAGLLFKRHIFIGNYFFFSGVYAISSIVAFVISINPVWAKSYFLLGLMTAALIFIIPNYFENEDIDLLEKAIIRSQFIVFPFSLYSIYMFYVCGGLPNKINIIGGLSITLDSDTLLRGQASSQIRLMLPYSTPPVLSVALAICVMILITNKNLYGNKTRRLLIILFSVCLIFTGSRTGLIGLALAILILLYRKYHKKGKLKVSNVAILIFGFIGVLFLLAISQNSIYLVKFFRRFSNFDFLQDRHFLVPLDGLIIWISSLNSFFFGIGTGSSLFIQGAHTYLPAYFLNSFITLVAERGILGLYLVICLTSLPVSLLKKAKKLSDSKTESVGLSLMTGLLCCIFYEALNCYLLVFVIAVAFMTNKPKLSNKFQINTMNGDTYEYINNNSHF